MEIREKDYFKLHFYNSKLPNLIESCINVLEILDNNYFRFPQNINNKRTLFNCLPGAQASIYSLYGINELICIGNIIDSFVLIRKIRDNLFLDLFLLSNDYNTREISLDSNNNNPKSELEDAELMNLLKEMIKEDTKIQKWFFDKYLDKNAKKERRELISYRHFLKTVKLRKSTIEKAYELYFETILENIGNTLDNFVHSNGFTVVRNELLNKPNDRLKENLNIIYSLIEDILIVYLATTILMNSVLIGTEDYENALYLDIPPEEDSQYWVAPDVTSFLKKHVKKKYPEVFLFIKNNQEYQMDLSEI